MSIPSIVSSTTHSTLEKNGVAPSSIEFRNILIGRLRASYPDLIRKNPSPVFPTPIPFPSIAGLKSILAKPSAAGEKVIETVKCLVSSRSITSNPADNDILLQPSSLLCPQIIDFLDAPVSKILPQS